MSVDVHFSSNSNEWQTPKDLFDKLNQEFSFCLDAAATKENSLCKSFFTKEDDALVQDWHKYKFVWCNPPYGRLIGKFVEKAYQEALRCCTVCLLIPARTDTKWWYSYCALGEVRFIKGRLKFINPDGPRNLRNPQKSMPAPFPSALVIFRPYNVPKTLYIAQ